MTVARKIRVLVIDDSALVRKLLTEILNSDPEIEVVGTAMDPEVARRKIKELNPDVLTLDVEMPKMDGISFLRHLMRLRPMPVLMVSSLTANGAEVTLDALAAGAVDFVCKPKIDVSATLQDYAAEITSKLKAAARVRVTARATVPAPEAMVRPTPAGTGEERYAATVPIPRPSQSSHLRTTEKIIAIGASTGGTEAIKDVLVQLPPDCPGTLVAQHIPPVFSSAFAKRMDQITDLTVCEAEHGQPVLPGHVYIAPGDRHLLLTRDGARYRCELSSGPLVNRHMPSVDVLFQSVARSAGRNGIGVILTGMGADGARGMAEMKQAGSITIAQDEKSSVVWGMPGEAVKLGAAGKVLPLDKIAAGIMLAVKELQQ